ncbi:tautomerase family protein [Edaphobacter sp.]|uniref:tautomerase family protein n=1 Tax=Edaphobacter sp. TaxID=1934404 RepID=UPI002DB9450F|nr:tautomerase family protein [Edaphobacter sp.]HEU5341573.1 tautomerase family protein [Edaphobacter sp.]
MPLVRISMKTGRTEQQKRQIADAIYDAMHQTLNVPEDDRFQVVTEYPDDGLLYGENYMNLRRTDGVVFIQIFLRRGRSLEMKQAFYRRVAELMHERAGVRMEDSLIVLTENGPEDWSFGNGIAQYAG